MPLRRQSAGEFWTRPTPSLLQAGSQKIGTDSVARSGQNGKAIEVSATEPLSITLIETGMRRAAVTRLNLKDIDFKKKRVSAEEKGGLKHTYKITTEGISAISDYIDKERVADDKKWKSEALLLSPETTPHCNWRLNPRVINTVWNDVCSMAKVEGKGCLLFY